MAQPWIQALGRLNVGTNTYMIPKKDSYLNGLLRATYSSKDSRHNSASPKIVKNTVNKKK
jgi:hypothetical protein